MPNLWSQYTQKIYETLYGPRTKDTEFDIKVEEIKACEKTLQGVKVIFNNFQRNTQGLKFTCKEVYTNFGVAYSESSPYWNTVGEITQVYQEIERLYDSMAENIKMLTSQTAEWDRNFDDVKKNLAIRAEYRSTYDHYDEKLEKLVRIRNEKSMRGVEEPAKESVAFDRNDLKYKKATDDYLKQSLFTYNLMCELLEFRYKLINPVMITFINEERKFYTSVADLFKRFENLQGKFQNLDRALKKEGFNYDPRKYVRGYKLLQGVNVSELPPLKENEDTKKKFSYEEYVKNKNTLLGTQTNSNQNISNKFPSNQPSNNEINQFSYEQYIANQKGGSSTSSTSNVNVNKKESINSNFYSPEFNKLNNNYSINQQNQNQNQDNNLHSMTFNNNVNLNKPDDLKRTTIVGEDTNVNEQQEENNPYSFLSFNDFTPNKHSSVINSTIPHTQMPQMGSSNYHYMNNSYNQPRVSTSQINPNMPNVNNFNNPYNYGNTNLPTNQEVNKNNDPNMKFPR